MIAAEFVVQASVLMTMSPLHRSWTITDVVRLLYPPVSLGQVVYITNTEGRVAGFATYGFFSEEASRGFIDGSRKLQPTDWTTEGGRIWAVDVLSPQGNGTPVARLLRAKLCELGYKGKNIYFRRKYGGKVRINRVCL